MNGEDLQWKKSTHSASGDQCVEVASLSDGRRYVRHSKDPKAAMLAFTPGEWDAFLRGVKAGEFDS